MSSIAIPNSVVSIGSEVFANCSSLELIVLSNRMTSISQGLFLDCSYLSSIVIPNSVYSIEYHAFEGCYLLENIFYYGTVREFNRSGIANDLPSSATIYYYSDKIPSDYGNYWYYDNGMPTIWF